MLVVSESDAAAIRTAFEQDDELSAAIELRRRFPASPTMSKQGHKPAHRRLEAAARDAASGDAIASRQGPLKRLSHPHGSARRRRDLRPRFVRVFNRLQLRGMGDYVD
jgi:hypothetical protein